MNIAIPEWSSTELDIMRIGLGFVVLLTFDGFNFFRPSGPPTRPVGVARFVNLQWLTSRTAARWMRWAVWIAALLYASDRWVPIALLVLSIAVVAEMTLASSYGAVNHGRHLLAIVLCAQLVAALLWSGADHWGWDLGRTVARTRDATLAWWSIQAIVAAYFTAGLSKVINTRGTWVRRSPGLLLSARAKVETNELMGRLGWRPRQASGDTLRRLSDRPNRARAIFAAGLLMELAAPFGLFGETALMLVGLGLIGVHVASGRTLGLPFISYQLLLLIYLVNLPRLVR